MVVGGSRPSGTVTFLFTDVEGSTVLWDRFPGLMGVALARHDLLVRDAIEEHGGVVFAAGGDGFGAAFASASDAAMAAVAAQRALTVEPWADQVRIRVRMGLHTGTAEERGGDYFGVAVSRAARIADVGCGGQIIVSAATAALIAGDGWAGMSDLGAHRLKGLERPERLYRLDAEGLAVVDGPVLRGTALVGNLPAQRAGLVGRRRELEDLDRVLVPGALVTVMGVGGVGKTRLALAAARVAAPRFVDGVWMMEFGQVVAPGDVAPLVATVLRVQPTFGLDTVSGVAAALERQHCLLLLDNCEHVIDAAMEVIEAIGARCPGVTVLATSREAFGLDGERIRIVTPMALDSDSGVSEAAQLFCERATGVLGDFDLGVDDLAVVENICRRLDGLPLALELAAARLPAISLAELDTRLSDRFGLLTRRRGAVERHHSLRTTVAWSYDLLAPDERLLFDRLSVFAGGFDLAAAEAVSGRMPAGAIDDLLASLVNKSLVVADRRSPSTRFRLLEILRQFGEERLEAQGEAIEVRRRHLDHFVAWAERADAGVKSADELRWHRAFLAEWPNLRNAFSWSCELDDGNTACRLLRAVLWWSGTRVQMEVADWSDTVLTLPTAVDHPVRPVAAAGASYFTFVKGDAGRSKELIDLARSEEERIGPFAEPYVPALAAFPDSMIGPDAALADMHSVQRRAEAADMTFWLLCGRLQEASLRSWSITNTDLPAEVTAANLARIREVAEFADQVGNPNGIAHACMALGGALRHSDPGEALSLLERAVDMSAPLDIELTANQAREHLALLYVSLGRHHDALALMGPTIQRHVRAGAWNQVWMSVLPILTALARLGHPGTVVHVLGAWRHDPTVPYSSTQTLQPLERHLRARLGAVKFDQLLNEGKQLTITAVAPHILRELDEALA